MLWLRVVVSLVYLFLVKAQTRDRNQKPYRLVCNYGSWTINRQGAGAMDIEDIDPTLCTHLMYCFANIENNMIVSAGAYRDLPENNGRDGFKRFIKLRDKNPQLTVMIAMGGWADGSPKYSTMASNADTRKIFIDSVVNFLDRHGFDGLGLDWEFPANFGGGPQDKRNFITLLKELKDAFSPKGYVLSTTVSGNRYLYEAAYDVVEMAKYLDFINLMTYNLHGSWDIFTGHNAPLFAKASDENIYLNVDFAVKHWLQAPAKKLNLGMSFFGRSFTLGNPAQTGVGAPATGAGLVGPFSNNAGLLEYNEICWSIKDERWEVVRDEEMKAPYAFKGNQWVGYDDQISLLTKVDYLKEKSFGGGMIFALEMDDITGRCQEGKFPLINAVSHHLFGDNPKDAEEEEEDCLEEEL